MRELWERAERDPEFHKELAILEYTEELWRVMQEHGVSGTELGRRIGSSQAYISRVLNGGANFTLATMTKLAMGLGMELKMHLAPADAFTVWRDVLLGSTVGSTGGRVLIEATLTRAPESVPCTPPAAAYAVAAATRRTDYTTTIDNGGQRAATSAA
jgi:transcriptional regulator with XRE-family HTH domain